MTRYVAFLRAINVGGHTVKMTELKQLFQTLDLENVETFIASGNVIFETASKKPNELTRKIEMCLHAALGYEVATFIRTTSEVAEIARYQPFKPSEGANLYIAFLKTTSTNEVQQKILSMRNDIDQFRFHNRELYWLCQTTSSHSEFSGAVFEKATKIQATFRNVTTVKRIADRFTK
jgi:uncharacterized protein (DUF1697 family)